MGNIGTDICHWSLKSSSILLDGTVTTGKWSTHFATGLFSFQRYAKKPKFCETFNTAVTRSTYLFSPISTSVSVPSNFFSHLIPNCMNAIALHSFKLLGALLSPFSLFELYVWEKQYVSRTDHIQRQLFKCHFPLNTYCTCRNQGLGKSHLTKSG